MLPLAADAGTLGDDLSEVLERYWGYTSFRPLQRRRWTPILGAPRLGRRAADRRRQVALLPGAGARPPGPWRRRVAAHLADEGPGRHARRQRRAGRALQQLAELGREERRSSAGLREGRYRLLYVSPERLAGEGGDGFLSTARRSATCSSSRSTKRTASASGGTTSVPNTGSLDGCAQLLPGVSLHAYTATATARVRRDIASQLGLRDAARARRLVRSARTSSTACWRAPA